jgi:hypothetical protein
MWSLITTPTPIRFEEENKAASTLIKKRRSRGLTTLDNRFSKEMQQYHVYIRLDLLGYTVRMFHLAEGKCSHPHVILTLSLSLWSHMSCSSLSLSLYAMPKSSSMHMHLLLQSPFSLATLPQPPAQIY